MFKKIKNWFFNLKKKKQKQINFIDINNLNNNCEVLIINDESESEDYFDILGISKERVDELNNYAFQIYNKKDIKISELINQLSKICKHPNELFILSMMYGVAEHTRTLSLNNDELTSFLKKIKPNHTILILNNG